MSAKHDGEKPFECNFCDAKFPAKGSRNKHLKDVHKIENVPKDPVETNSNDPLKIWFFILEVYLTHRSPNSWIGTI